LTPDSIAWLFSLERLGMKFGLENIAKLMAALGEPHHRFPSVLIAGTNGKGSVTAMVDEALRAGGFRSGRYTSPHLLRIEERFVIDGREIETPALEDAVHMVRRAVDGLLDRGELDAPATFFECATAAAFQLFASARVDIAVLEVGLGGRLDATNVVTPVVCAITTIDFDHQAQLGSTIRSIAAEKAGIIKPSVPVVIGRLPADAEEVIRTTAREAHAPVIDAHAARPFEMELSLPGAHQRDNALVALAILRELKPRGFAIDDRLAARALATVRWPGRLERFRRGDSDVLLDAAHNPAGARALADYMRESGWTDATLVFGAMADKDARGMLDVLLPVASRIIFTTASTPRAERATTLASLVPATASKTVEIIDDPAAALSHATATSRRVVVAGSMFLIGPLRGILR
jgi:dihydrofolate synthase / folylpolyglutamate synthase